MGKKRKILSSDDESDNSDTSENSFDLSFMKENAQLFSLGFIPPKCKWRVNWLPPISPNQIQDSFCCINLGRLYLPVPVIHHVFVSVVIYEFSKEFICAINTRLYKSLPYLLQDLLYQLIKKNC